MKYLIYLLCLLVFFEYLMDIVRAIAGKDYTEKYYGDISDRFKKMSESKFFNFRFFVVIFALIMIFISAYVAFNIEV